MVWQQNYDPFHNIILSCTVASIPVIVMMALLGIWHMKAHYAAALGLISALLISIFVFGMPAQMAGLAAGFRCGLRAAADRLDRAGTSSSCTS